MMGRILYTLPTEFNTAKSIWETTLEKDRTIDLLMERLRNEDERLKQRRVSQWLYVRKDLQNETIRIVVAIATSIIIIAIGKATAINPVHRIPIIMDSKLINLIIRKHWIVTTIRSLVANVMDAVNTDI